MLDESEHVSVPTWTCRGCAAGGAAVIASDAAAMTAAAKQVTKHMEFSPRVPRWAVSDRIVGENDAAVLSFRSVHGRDRPVASSYFKLPQKRWMRAQASSSALVAVA